MDGIVPAGQHPPDSPAVSVLLATYGRPALLGRALESMAAQTLDQALFETIVIINGPITDSRAVVENFCARNPGTDVRIIESETPGVAHARTLGLWAARGDYMTILDDDDWVSPAYLEQLLAHVEPGVIPVAWMADIFDEVPDEARFDNYFSAKLVQHRGTTVAAHQLRQAISLNVCKLVPVDAARAVGYDLSLKGGSDFVFWTKLYARDRFRFRVIDSQDAVYYRTRGHGSLSRQDPTFEFAITWRLNCIASLDELPPGSPDVEDMVMAMVRAQCGHLNRYLLAHPDERPQVVAAIKERRLTRFDWRTVNKGTARDLALLYCFTPWNGTSGLVAARRVRDRGLVVDVICQSMDGARDRDPSSAAIADEYVATQHAIPGEPAFAHWPEIAAYSRAVLKTLERWAEQGRTYDSVYSRAMWVASHLTAAQYKLRNPEVRWVAEFSDPLNRTILGEPRVGKIPWWGGIYAELADGIEAAGFARPTGSSLFEIGEHVAYALADEVVFTNENQRTYMLGYCPDVDLAQRAHAVSRIDHHPTPPAELYDADPVDYPLDPDRAHLAYFGVFYPTRGLTEVTEALAALPGAERSRVQLHVFTDKPDVIRAGVWEAGLADVVVVNPYLPYTAFLNVTRNFDALIVNDASTAAHHAGINPYLPSKISDYRGSGRPIWAIYEPGSVLSTQDVTYRTALGDVDGAVEVLRGVVAAGHVLAGSR